MGQYIASVVKAETAMSKASNEMINLQWKVSGGKFDGRIIFDQLVFAEKSLFRVKRTLLGLGYPKDHKGNIDPNLLVGKSAMLTVDIEESTQIDPETGEPYPPRNRVKKVAPISKPAPGVTAK